MTVVDVALGEIDKRVVLTGAGFSRNWGGYLASEMWGAILGHPAVEARDRLRQALLDQTNFEDAIFEVRTRRHKFDDQDRVALDRAVEAAFEIQDGNLRRGGSDPSWNYARGCLLQPIAEARTTSFFFTLNQDIFFEREWLITESDPITRVRRTPTVPGVLLDQALWFQPEPPPNTRRADAYGKTLELNIPATAPSTLASLGNLNYIKLHGSFNWRTTGSDGPVMVLGGGKRAAIQEFSLLAAYFDLFRRVLMSGDVRLLVIGYGFGDEHVNEILDEAATKANLRLILVEPRPAEDVRRQLLLKGSARIWGSVVGLCNRTLAQVFERGNHPGHGPDSGEVDRLREIFVNHGVVR